MDAREVIRHFLQGTDLSCDDLITALEWHGNRIIHRDENHGPTLDRVAAVAKCAWVSANYDLIGIANADMANALCEHTEAEIRAMEVKHDG